MQERTGVRESLWRKATRRIIRGGPWRRKSNIATATTAPETQFDISDPIDPLEELKIVSEVAINSDKRDRVEARLQTGVDNLLTNFARFKDIDLIEEGTEISVRLATQQGDRPIFFRSAVKIREGQPEKRMFIISFSPRPGESGKELQSYVYFTDGEVIRKASGKQYSELSGETDALHLTAEIDYLTGNLPEVGEAEMNFVLNLAEKESVGPLPLPARKFKSLHYDRIHGEKVDTEQSKQAAAMFGGYIDDFLEDHGYATDKAVVHKDEFTDVFGNTVIYEAGKRLEQGELVPFANIEVCGAPALMGVQVYTTHEFVTDQNKGLVNTRRIGSKTEGPEVRGDRIENKGQRSIVLADLVEARAVRNFLAAPQ